MEPSSNVVDLAGMPAPRSFVVNGTRFPLVAVGLGAPILFVHGAWADHRIWCGFWQPVSQKAKFLAITQRHFGDWKWPGDKPFARRVHTEDLIDILDALEEPVHIVGWSYAGGILLRAAATKPERVLSLAIFEPSFECEPPTESGPLKTAREVAWNRLEPAYELAENGDLERGMRVGLEAVYSMQAGEFFELHPDIQKVHLENRHTMLPDLNAESAEPLSFQEFTNISCPTLILYGEKSLDQYRLMAEYTNENIGGAKLVMVPSVSHGAPVQRPDLLANAILEFILGIAAARRK
ncbi:haloalkane dehalogenase [Ruegeria denitrificans]|uniref:Haloalkane dehalogenase n=1 Tax=Ruegeria denitrificans TaxID=1715692 RepID=A0A0P1IAP9_9RHOB|nr:haloalkane dehalogenase [Ruegeria denitrificans]